MQTTNCRSFLLLSTLALGCSSGASSITTESDPQGTTGDGSGDATAAATAPTTAPETTTDPTTTNPTTTNPTTTDPTPTDLTTSGDDGATTGDDVATTGDGGATTEDDGATTGDDAATTGTDGPTVTTGGDGLCVVQSGELAACDQPASGAAVQGTLPCDIPEFYDIYEVSVSAGDCVHIVADNIDPLVGATGETQADLFAIIYNLDGEIAFLDDETPCTDPTFGGDWACPEGGGVAADGGTLLVGIAQYGGAGCPDGAPYVLDIAVNGVAYDPGAPIEGPLQCDLP